MGHRRMGGYLIDSQASMVTRRSDMRNRSMQAWWLAAAEQAYLQYGNVDLVWRCLLRSVSGEWHLGKGDE